jgi:hypothetical protein
MRKQTREFDGSKLTKYQLRVFQPRNTIPYLVLTRKFCRIARLPWQSKPKSNQPHQCSPRKTQGRFQHVLTCLLSSPSLRFSTPNHSRGGGYSFRLDWRNMNSRISSTYFWEIFSEQPYVCCERNKFLIHKSFLLFEKKSVSLSEEITIDEKWESKKDCQFSLNGQKWGIRKLIVYSLCSCSWSSKLFFVFDWKSRR